MTLFLKGFVYGTGIGLVNTLLLGSALGWGVCLVLAAALVWIDEREGLLWASSDGWDRSLDPDNLYDEYMK